MNVHIEMIHHPPDITDENRTPSVKNTMKFQDTKKKSKPPGRGLEERSPTTEDQETTASGDQQLEVGIQKSMPLKFSKSISLVIQWL